MTNLNTSDYLDKVKTRLFENLRMLPHAPGVQVQAIPEDGIKMDVDDQDGTADGDTEAEKDERQPKSEKDKRIIGDNEYSDSEDEGPTGDGRKNRESHKNPRKKQKTNDSKEGTSDVIKDEKLDEKPSDTDKSTPAESTEKKDENGTSTAATAKKEESNETAVGEQ